MGEGAGFSTREDAMEVDFGSSMSSWSPRKPLVQWAVQLETFGGSRFTPQHIGAQPCKSCLKERRGPNGQELAEGAGAQQLDKLSVPKTAFITHPKPVGPLTGMKRSRMAAFR